MTPVPTDLGDIVWGFGQDTTWMAKAMGMGRGVGGRGKEQDEDPAEGLWGEMFYSPPGQVLNDRFSECQA